MKPHLPFLLILIMVCVQQLVWAQPPSRGQATEMIIAGDNSLQMLDLEQAIEYYSSAISLDPSFADAYMKRANAFSIAGRSTEAQADYNMAVNINPYIDYLYDSRAKVKILVADFKDALVDVNNVFQGPVDITQWYILTEMRRTYPTSLVQLDSLIAANPTVSKNYGHRAVARWEADDANGALADVNQALELNPTNAMALNMLGLLQLEKSNYGGAITAFEAAIRIDENYTAAYLNRGRAYYLSGNELMALNDMDKAILLDSNFTLAYFSRAMVYKNLGKADDAIRDYDKVIALQPNFADAYFSRGTARKMQGDFAGAIRDYDQSILLNPNDAAAFNNRAILRVLADDYAGASKDFRSAISLQPDYAAAYHNLGMALIMSHSRTEGCDYLQTSITKGFENAQDQYKYFCTQ